MENIRGHCPNCNHPNKKFYYTIEKGKRKGYCFHCGYSVNQKANYRDVQPKQPTTNNKWTRPHDADNNWGRWTEEAIKWLMKYNINQVECIKYDIFYAPSWGKDRLWLTIGEGHWQGRDLTGKDKIKYLTKKNTTQVFNIQGDNICLLTEDIISAIKGFKLTGHSSMALSGTNLSKGHIKKLLDMDIDTVLVCLDNDNAKVRKLQETIKKRLDNFFNCSIVRLNKDLKCFKSLEFLRS